MWCDLKSKQRVARWDLAQKVDPLVSIQVSEDDKPLFYGLTATSDLVMDDAQRQAAARREAGRQYVVAARQPVRPR